MIISSKMHTAGAYIVLSAYIVFPSLLTIAYGDDSTIEYSQKIVDITASIDNGHFNLVIPQSSKKFQAKAKKSKLFPWRYIIFDDPETNNYVFEFFGKRNFLKTFRNKWAFKRAYEDLSTYSQNPVDAKRPKKQIETIAGDYIDKLYSVKNASQQLIGVQFKHLFRDRDLYAPGIWQMNYQKYLTGKKV